MDIVTFLSPVLKTYLDDAFIIAIPTETVYGLAIRWDSPLAYRRLIDVKHRPVDKPIAVMCQEEFPFDEYFMLNDGIKNVMKHFLPGPLTVVLKKKVPLPYQVDLNTGCVGIRVPKYPPLLKFLKKIKVPLQVTSANVSSSKPLTNYHDIKKEFDKEENIKAVVKSTIKPAEPSTVVLLVEDKIELIRKGKITKKEIEEVYYGR